MSDVNTFIETIGHDVHDTVAPKVQDFVATIIQDLFHRYRPELAGELHTKLTNGAVQVTGQNVRLEMKRRDTGASVATLDIPVALVIKVDDLSLKLQNTTLRLDVVR